jgi:hypothetical protein
MARDHRKTWQSTLRQPEQESYVALFWAGAPPAAALRPTEAIRRFRQISQRAAQNLKTERDSFEPQIPQIARHHKQTRPTPAADSHLRNLRSLRFVFVCWPQQVARAIGRFLGPHSGPADVPLAG